MTPGVSDRSLRTLSALADALLPPGEHLPGAIQAATDRRAAELIARLPVEARRLVAVELMLLEHGSRLAGGRPFSALNRTRRDAVLARVESLPGLAGQALSPLALLLTLAHAGQPAVLEALGAEPAPGRPRAGGAETSTPVHTSGRLPVRAAPDVEGGLDETFDAVIVGSGAGGAPVARTLARAGWSVAVVEEGDAVAREDFAGPELDRVGRLYRDGGATVTLGNPVVAVPLGRAVGGTTVVNSGTCFRTPDRIVASWHRRNGIELRPDDLGPYYEDVEATLGVAPASWDVLGGNAAVVHRGALALGIPGRPIDRNAPGCVGSGVCAAGCPVDAKRGVHLNYLPQAVDAGAVIFARARADRIDVRGGRAAAVGGVLFDPMGRPTGAFRLRARRAVVLAAGAPFTPTLLRRAGIRNRSLGRNLRIHPAIVAGGMFDEEIRGWNGVLQSYLIDELADRGIMIEATFPRPSLAYAEAGSARRGAERIAMLERLPNMAVLGALVSDTSSGRVFDRGPGRTPLMTYRLNANDRGRAMEAMRLCAKVLFAAGAQAVHPMLAGARPIVSPAGVEASLPGDVPASRFRLTAYHPMGTARMGGPNDAGAVLDSDGRVRGIDRLAVVDASVFPGSLGVNPQVTIMAFASRAGDRMAERWG